MRSIGKTILFILFSFADLHIEAKEIVTLPLAKKVLMQPNECVLKSSVCVVRTQENQKYILPFGESSAILDEKSLVIRESSDTVSLVKGRVWVKAVAKSVKVKSEFGTITGEPGTEVWVERRDKKLIISVTKGMWLIHAKGAREPIRIDEGFQNWLGSVNQNGIAQTGIPRAIDFESHIYLWAKLYAGPRESFKKEVADLGELWSRAISEAASLHQAHSERYIAAVAEKKKQEEEKIRLEKEDQRRFREMLIKRNNLDIR